MALDRVRIRETKPVINENNENMLDDIRSLNGDLDSLEMDLDWIRKNEGREYTISSFFNKNKNQLSKDKDESIMKQFNEDMALLWGDTNKVQTTPNVNETSKIEVTTDPTVSETVPPTIVETTQPVINTTTPVIVEPEIFIDNNALFAELNDRINKKYNHLLSSLSTLYNSEVINQEANSIQNDLENIMNIKDKNIDELKKVDSSLNFLISRFAKLSQKSNEVKAADDFKIKQQEAFLKELNIYQNYLQSMYGSIWIAKMNDQEKEKYINLYIAAHNVSRYVVEKQIEDSVAKLYEEKINQKPSETKPPFKREMENVIKFNGRKALDTLKQIYASLGSATPEQITEFKIVYNELSRIANFTPTNLDEENKQLTQLFDVTDKINLLRDSLNINMNNNLTDEVSKSK